MHVESGQFQDQLVRGLAHRMNNILTLFHGYVGLLMDNNELDRTTREGLTKIKEGAKQASELMDRTHSLVRPSTVIWRELDLSEFIPMLKPCFEPLRSQRTVLEIVCPDTLPRVCVDAGRLKTALVELVKNAFEATTGGGTVRIEVASQHQDGAPLTGVSSASQPLHWVCIKVTDDGPGISQELNEKIFQPFFTTKKRSNAGLGLNVAAGSVQQLGGILRHGSQPGKTWFEILLPARPELM